MSYLRETKLIEPFAVTVYNSKMKDVATDFAEIAIDDLISMMFPNVTETLLSIPLVKYAIAVGKTVWDIKQWFTLRNQLTIIQSLKLNNVDPKRVEKRRKALEKREPWIYKEIEISVLYLDRYTYTKKAVYQARMYTDLINEKISFAEYEEYLTILDQLFIKDIDHLLEIVPYIIRNQEDFYNNDKLNEVSKHFDKVRCGRMESMGVLEGLITSRIGMSTKDRFILTDRGEYLYRIFIEDEDTEYVKK